MDSIKLISIQDYIDNPISLREFFNLVPEIKRFGTPLDTYNASFPVECKSGFSNVWFLDKKIKETNPDLLNRTIEHFEISDNMDSISIVLNDESKSSSHNDKKINVSLGRFLSSIKTVNGKGTYLDVSDRSIPEKYRSVYIRASHLYNLIAYYSDQDTLDRTIESISYISALDSKTSISVIKVVLKE